MSRPVRSAIGNGSRAAVREDLCSAGDVRLLVNRAWEARFPDLVSVTTAAPADFGLGGPGPVSAVARRYESLAGALGCSTIVVARQVHGTKVRVIESAPVHAMVIAGEADGLASDSPGVLLAVTVADCVPVHILDPLSGGLALLHAGWRGAAEGILTSGVRALAELRGARPSDLLVHLGPAICGDCYEVGPEVLRRFGLETDAKGPLDLRSWLSREALRLGVPDSAISRSTWCTRCSPGVLHSHRGSDGTAGRMVACLGWRGAPR